MQQESKIGKTRNNTLVNMKKAQNTIELTYEEREKIEEEGLKIKRDEYIVNMKTNLNYQYLMNNFKGLILNV